MVAASCVIIGDSIAVGTASQAPACRVNAEVGISSRSYARERVDQVNADTVVISLGANDHPSNLGAPEAMEIVRSRISARRVVWLLPSCGARAAAIEVARRHGDATIDAAPFAGADGIHPTAYGYRTLATEALNR
jgi:lysophospholipase L1-like esterase